MAENDFRIIIKKGKSELIIKRSELVSCSETADGIVFQINNGLLIHYTDNQMHPATKMKIKNTIDSMTNGNIEVDFNNCFNPVRFFAPDK